MSWYTNITELTKLFCKIRCDFQFAVHKGQGTAQIKCMGNVLVFLNKAELKFYGYFINNFSWFAKNKVCKGIKSIHICHLSVLTGKL